MEIFKLKNDLVTKKMSLSKKALEEHFKQSECVLHW